MVERVAFRGKFAADAQQIKPDEYLKMIKSRQRRSIKRNGMLYRQLQEKVEAMKKKGSSKPIKTHVREAVIIPAWIGLTFKVHNGKEFQDVNVTANMLGHRLGEFAFTTKRVLHSTPGIRATKGSKFLAVK